MRVIVGCEFSQIVTKAFRDRGFEASSCDLLPTEGNPEWHFQEDISELLKREQFDLGIFHPPCTYLAASGSRWFKNNPERYRKMQEAFEFIKQLWNADIKYIAIENPVGRLSTLWRKPDQYIQPYQFGEPTRKKTGLWLKNLPLLIPTKIVEPKIIKYQNGRGTDSEWHIKTFNLPAKTRKKERSRTFVGIAEAMAKQWGDYIRCEDRKAVQMELF